MQLQLLTALLYATSLVSSAPSPPSQLQPNTNAISARDAESNPNYQIWSPSSNSLEKRKGGGGGRSGGGGSSSGGGRSGGSSGGGRPASSYSFSPSSNAGGRTREGSGSPPLYGNRYAGGAMVPYTSGATSPTRSIAPYAIGAGALAFFPGLWLYSVYAYPYGYPYYWTNPTTGRNESTNTTCLCQEYSVCGCDPTDNSTFLAQQLTNGSTSGPPVNTSLVRTVTFDNGSTMSYINGTLDNGTTASGGTDPSNADEISGAQRLVINYGGYWSMVAIVVGGVMFL